jgi:thiol-disulfide isomerase/thioredoxin
MKRFRHAPPFLGVLVLIALFLKMPAAASCAMCSSRGLYMPLFGAGYFALLIAASLLFLSFPDVKLARTGLTWAILLALLLTYVDFPQWCGLCLTCHICHILMWTIWLVVPPLEAKPTLLKERIYLLLLAPISVVALFTSLNLTLMTYRPKTHSNLGFQPGDLVPAFTAWTVTGHSITNAEFLSVSRTILNFVSIDCPYCKEQLQLLNTIILELDSQAYRFINITPMLPSNLTQYSSRMEWIEDKPEALLNLFQVSGYPTLFVVGTDGKIVQIIPGVPMQLKREMLSGFK